MNIITGYTGEPHVTPEQDAAAHRARDVIASCVFDDGECFEPYIESNTNVWVKDGICSIQGRYMCIDRGDHDEVQIASAAQGKKRIDIICAAIKKNLDGTSESWLEVFEGAESAGTPVAPTIPETDLDGGDNEAYLPLVQVTIDGITITAADFIGDMFELAIDDDVLEAELTAILGDISV